MAKITQNWKNGLTVALSALTLHVSGLGRGSVTPLALLTTLICAMLTMRPDNNNDNNNFKTVV